MALRVPLPAEIALARAAAGLSRLAGTGGGTTLPGKLLWKLDPGAVDRLAARLPEGTALVSATNGKTTTAAMAARILAPSLRLAHNRSGANLVSGVASALLASPDAELGLFEVDELSRERPATVFGLDDPRHAAAELQHAADSKWCVRCGTPYVYAAAYIGHLGDYRCEACGHARPPLDVVARSVELNGLESVSFELVTPDGTRLVQLAVPGLYNVYNALAAAGLTR